jgi:hypothetical protein
MTTLPIRSAAIASEKRRLRRIVQASDRIVDGGVYFSPARRWKYNVCGPSFGDERTTEHQLSGSGESREAYKCCFATQLRSHINNGEIASVQI